MFPNTTIRRVDIFQCEDNESCVIDVFRQIYNSVGGCDNLAMIASYERSGSFLASIRYFREHGYVVVPKSLTGPKRSLTGRWHVTLERVTMPMPQAVKLALLDDSEMPF